MQNPSTKLILILAIVAVLACGAAGAGAGLVFWLMTAPPAGQTAAAPRPTVIARRAVAFRAADTATPLPTPVKPTATPRPTSTPKPTATPRPTATPKPTATPTQPPSPTSPKGDGFFLVGSEIAPGKWRSTGSGDSCYWARLDDQQGILDNHFGMTGGVMTILPTDFMVELADCGTWQYMDDPAAVSEKPTPPPNRPDPRTDLTVCDVELNSDYQGVYVQWVGSVMDDYPSQDFQVWWENPVEGTACDYSAFFVTYAGGEPLYTNDIVLVTGEIIDTAYEYANSYGSRQYGVVVRADEVVILNKPVAP